MVQIIKFAFDREENILGKGENFLLYSKFFLFKQVVEILNCVINDLTLYQILTTFNDPVEELFGNNCGKGSNCWLPAFSPFHTLSRINFKS